MNRVCKTRGRMSAVLAAALLFLCLSPAAAAAEMPGPAETTVNTIPLTEPTEPAAESTTAPTIPSDTEAVPESTAESVPESTATLPVETAVEPSEPTTIPTTTGELLTESVPLLTTAPTVETAEHKADTKTEVAKQPEADAMWYPVPPEEILSTDRIAVTVTRGGVTWALSSENGDAAAPAAIAVTLQNGVMLSAGPGLVWTLSRAKGMLRLYAENTRSFLYTDTGNDALRVGSIGDADWSLSGGVLRHVLTDRCLCVDTERGIWQARRNPPEGQTLRFWRRERTVPVVATPAGGILKDGESVRLSCADPAASIWCALSTDGEHYTPFAVYNQPITMAAEADRLYIRAYTQSPKLPPSPTLEFSYTRATEVEPKPDWALPFRFCFGQLHAHTSLSDGTSSPEVVFRAAAAQEMDFFAVTDHSDSLEDSIHGALGTDGSSVSPDWAAGKVAAAAVTDENFVGLFGFEMSWPEGKYLGHIGTFATPGWQSWKQKEFSSLERYYQAMAAVPASVGQFNHPGEQYGDFERFTHRTAAADRQMALLEVGGEGRFRAFDAYTRALDMGWHIAPTGSGSVRQAGDFGELRTVLLATSLSEDALYNAMRSRRVYFTEDRDLEICFTLNGSFMGEIMGRPKVCQLKLMLHDPTDEAVGLVEVITDGGRVAASMVVEKPWAELELTLPGRYSYCYLRITQPDGDRAVTAPVWMDTLQDLGISDFSCETTPVVQGQPARVTLKLFNEEVFPFTVDSVTLRAGGKIVCADTTPFSVEAAGTAVRSFSWTPPEPGVTELCVRVTGTINGQRRSFEKSVRLRCHVPSQVGVLLVDGSHENAGLDEFGRFSAIAGEADLRVTVVEAELPTTGKLLVIPPPGRALEGAFVDRVKTFLKNGGSLILPGSGEAAETLNGLLRELGMSMRFGSRVEDLDMPADYNSRAVWSREISRSAFCHHHDGRAVRPGQGQWLIRHPDTGAVLLACEETGHGGTVFVGGSAFLSDDCLPQPANRWDPVSANQRILEAILNVHRQELPLRTIREARTGAVGESFRIRGYATTGTVNPYNTFPETLCVQDETGGIPVIDFTDSGIEVGTPLELIGQHQEEDGNAVLALIDYRPLDIDTYRHAPDTIPCGEAMDYPLHGGELLQIEGVAAELVPTRDGVGLSRLTLTDDRGDSATVVIDDGIGSGAQGTNTLAAQFRPGDTVRAMGILYLEAGQPVLRVRNCEEVVYVPPLRRRPDRTNPGTADPYLPVLALLPASGGSLCFLLRKRRK